MPSLGGRLFWERPNYPSLGGGSGSGERREDLHGTEVTVVTRKKVVAPKGIGELRSVRKSHLCEKKECFRVATSKKNRTSLEREGKGGRLRELTEKGVDEIRRLEDPHGHREKKKRGPCGNAYRGRGW